MHIPDYVTTNYTIDWSSLTDMHWDNKCTVTVHSNVLNLVQAEFILCTVYGTRIYITEPMQFQAQL